MAVFETVNYRSLVQVGSKKERGRVIILGRFMTRVEITETCWLWKGSKTRRYGSFGFNGKSHPAHRVSYELFVGPIPEGATIHYRCFTPLCVKPSPLEP